MENVRGFFFLFYFVLLKMNVESIAVKGMINQGGRVFKQRRIAAYDAPCVILVKKHGGIILLVSNTPELCMCWETYNNVSGT